MENVCRTCMDDSVTLVNIFSEVRDPALEQPDRTLSQILSECTNRPISRDDSQPKFICLSCVQAAQSAFRFKRQCDRSHQHFCELQNKSSLPGDQDQENKQPNDLAARQKEAPRAEDSRSEASTPKSSRRRNARSSSRIGGKNAKNVLVCAEQIRFGCPHCPRTYKTKRCLQRHLARHVSQPTHECPHCPKVFWRSDSYTGHLRIHEKEGFNFCSQCSTGFPDAIQLETHQREHMDNIIEEIISFPNDLDFDMINTENNLTVKSPPVPEPRHKYSCDLCTESYIEECDLSFHQLLTHEVSDPNTARESTTLMPELEQLNPTLDHLFNNNQLEDITIENSGDIIIEESDIVDSDDIPIARLKESGFDQDTNSSGQGEKENQIRNSKEVLFKCPDCQTTYKNQKSLRRHQHTHTSGPKYSCPVCSKNFFLRFKLNRHLRTHEKDVPLPCRLCSAVFLESNELKIHMRDHKKEKVEKKSKDKSIAMTRDMDKTEWEPQILNLSQKKSTTEDSSMEGSEDSPDSGQKESGFDQDTNSSGPGENHNMLPNAKEKLYKCSHCHCTFTNKKAMRRHFSTHTTKPRHTCQVCSKTYWRHDAYTRHLAFHAEEGVRYTCSQCPAKFEDKLGLRRHRRSAHEKRAVLKCKYCSKEYRSKKPLETHERNRLCD